MATNCVHRLRKRAREKSCGLGQPSGNSRSRKCGRASRSPYSITKSRNAAPWRSIPNENIVRPAISSVIRCIAARRSTGALPAAFSFAIVSSVAATICGISMLIPHMVAATDETIAKLKAAGNAPVDLRAAMQRMTLEIAGRTMFSFGMDRHGAALRDFVMEYGERLARPHFLDLVLPLSWPTPQDFSRARFRKRWTQFVGMLMVGRRAAGKNEGAPPRDLFDLMGEARDPETGQAFTDEQLGDQVATMILAGHETTATALFWSLYLLGLDPATQDQLAAEVQGATVNDASDIERLTFTRAVLDETMRLYPPVFLIARAAAAPDTIAGLPFRKRDVILIAPWLLHRHEKLWRDPNAFIPQRFMPP